MKYHMIIPTYKRPDKVIRLIKSIEDTIGDRIKDLKMFIVFDNNDVSGLREFASKYSFNELEVYISFSKTQKGAFGIWNEHMMNHFTCDGVFCSNDHCYFINGGIKHAIEEFEKHCSSTDYIMTLTQHTRQIDNAFIIGKEFSRKFEKIGFFYPEYKAHAADTEMSELAVKLGKHYMPEEIIWVHNKEEHTDETYRISVPVHRNNDVRMWEERRKKGLLWGVE